MGFVLAATNGAAVSNRQANAWAVNHLLHHATPIPLTRPLLRRSVFQSGMRFLCCDGAAVPPPSLAGRRHLQSVRPFDSTKGSAHRPTAEPLLPVRLFSDALSFSPALVCSSFPLCNALGRVARFNSVHWSSANSERPVLVSLGFYWQDYLNSTRPCLSKASLTPTLLGCSTQTS